MSSHRGQDIVTYAVMGLKNSPSYAQSWIDSIIRVKTYISRASSMILWFSVPYLKNIYTTDNKPYNT